MNYLFVNYYKNLERQNEIDYCLKKNLDNNLIDKIYIFTSFDVKIPFESKKIKIINLERPSYFDIINFINLNDTDSFNIISNSDIYFDDSLKMLNKIDFSKKKCIALSRHEVKDILISPTEKFAKTSQDCWIFKGNVQLDNMNDVKFNLGVFGCDNRFAYELSKNGYELLNFCYDIIVYHYHNTQRPIKKGIKIPPPYKSVETRRL